MARVSTTYRSLRPVRGGVARIVAQIRTRWPRLPVLLISGYAETMTAATAAGFPVLMKPFSLQALGDAIRVLRERPPLHRDRTG